MTIRSQTVPHKGMLAIACRVRAASSTGAEAPIVWLRQSKKVMLRPLGKGVSAALGSLLTAAVSLYPSTII